jgi:hypothetical protein
MDSVKYYNELLNYLKITFESTQIDDTDKYVSHEISDLENLDDEEKLNKCNNFYNILLDDELFILFTQSKIKVFSHKTDQTKQLSLSLLNENIPLRNLLNNQTDKIKQSIWNYLYKIYMYIELEKPMESQNLERMKSIDSLIDKSGNLTKDKIKKILEIDVDDQSSGMIDDIVESFEQILNDNSDTNPITKIIEVTQIITSKYADKIKNGDIKIDKLINYVVSKAPGLDTFLSDFMGKMSLSDNNEDDRIIMDSNFSTAQVEVGGSRSSSSNGINIGNILKMFNGNVLGNLGLDLSKLEK